MKTFSSIRDAKEFLISRIISEAQIENVPLTDIERKMLYFSETGWTLPDMGEVSDIFDREYDQSLYEKKIRTLAQNFCSKARNGNNNDLETWKAAVQTVCQEDHYLLVLIDALRADQISRQFDMPSSWGRFLKLSAIGFVIACVVLLVGYLVLRN